MIAPNRAPAGPPGKGQPSAASSTAEADASTAENGASERHETGPDEVVAGVFLQDDARAKALAAALIAVGIKAIVVTNTDALGVAVDAKRLDLFIIEQRFAGFFTGLEIIRKLRGALNWIPAILLDENDRLANDVKGVGAVTLLNRDVADVEIVKAVRRQLNRRSAESDLIPERAQILVERQIDLPVLSQLTLKLLRYLETPAHEVPISELCGNMCLDPRASAVLLKAANASANGVSREIATVPDAVRILGVRPTIGLVLNVAVTTGMGAMSKGLSSEAQSWHARRGMVIASTTSTFAKELEDRSEETAFLVGILQDVGILGLLRAYPKQYRQMLNRWRAVGQVRLAAIELSEFGCTHAEVSAAMMKRWGMSPALLLPVLYHLQAPATLGSCGLDTGIHRVMMIAEALADLIDSPHEFRRCTLNTLLAHYGPDKKMACLQSVKTSAQKASQAFQLLAVPVPSARELETMLRSALADETTDAAETAGSASSTAG